MTATDVGPAALMPGAFARTSLPGRIVFGDGALDRLATELDDRDLGRAMLIVASYDAALAGRGRGALGARVALEWSEIKQHVPSEVAERATSAAATADVDVLVAVGGGSTTGLGKAVAVATGLPLVVVPTTYAGSEMTPIYGLTATTRRRRVTPPRCRSS